MAKNILVENIFWNIFSKYFWPYFVYLEIYLKYIWKYISPIWVLHVNIKRCN